MSVQICKLASVFPTCLHTIQRTYLMNINGYSCIYFLFRYTLAFIYFDIITHPCVYAVHICLRTCAYTHVYTHMVVFHLESKYRFVYLWMYVQMHRNTPHYAFTHIPVYSYACVYKQLYTSTLLLYTSIHFFTLVYRYIHIYISYFYVQGGAFIPWMLFPLAQTSWPFITAQWRPSAEKMPKVKGKFSGVERGKEKMQAPFVGF